MKITVVVVVHSNTKSCYDIFSFKVVEILRSFLLRDRTQFSILDLRNVLGN